MNAQEAENQKAVAAAQSTLQAEQVKRKAQCTQAINEVLEQYRCQLSVQPGFTQDGRLICPINITVLP